MLSKLKMFGFVFLNLLLSLLSCALILVLAWFIIQTVMIKLSWMAWYWMFSILIIGLLFCTVILYRLISRLLD